MQREFEVTWHATVEAESAEDAAKQIEELFRHGVQDRPGMRFGVFDIELLRYCYFNLAKYPPVDITDVPDGMTLKEHLEATSNTECIAARLKRNREG